MNIANFEYQQSTKKISEKKLFDNIFMERDEKNIVWVYFDKLGSSANVLGQDVFNDLENILNALDTEPPVGLVFLSNKKSGFIVGADVAEFAHVSNAEQVNAIITRGQSMFNRIENSPFPTLSLIHGYCLGGGFELSLACDYRVACADEKPLIGLPEVLLGIHPGFGGSVRLIRLIGALKAMPLMLTGRSVDGRRALQLGIIDALVPRRQLHAAATKFIVDMPHKHRRSPLAGLLNSALLRPILARRMRQQVAQKVNIAHYPAPFALIDLWQDKGGNDARMMQGEADSLAELFMQPTAKNLVRVFLLQEQLKKQELICTDNNALEFTHVHVIGAGIMGGDIAAWCALKGLRVTLQDREARFLEPALARANKLFTRRLRDPYARQAAFDRLIPDLHGDGVAKADVVIEAIIENVEAKVALYKSIEPNLKPGAVLATNTSSIPLQELSAQLQQPDRLIGLHFFNPVAKMQLVEVIHAEHTDPQQIEKGRCLIRQISRLPLPTLSSPGFLVNRVLLPYLLEAVELLNEGVPAEIIDQVATDFGMPMGPIQLADTVGLDICYSVAKNLATSLQISVPDLLAQKVTEGRLGVKSGQGFYQYREGKIKRIKAKSRSPLPKQKIQDRLILRLLNECVAVLREGIIADSNALDVGMIFGTGFAPFSGGPMHYLQNRGAEQLYKMLIQLEAEYGERFHPDKGWELQKRHCQQGVDKRC